MEPEAPQLSPARVIFAATLGGAPVALWVALRFLRPALIVPMLGHVVGYTVTAVELLLVIGGVLVYLAAALQRGSGAKVGLSLAGLILCTLPAVLLMFFGPVAFAFTYGNIGR